ncbi:MAG: hypothetical protein L3K09_00675 [Thermoplasmata archaeon]|nr:hypothetical protein [Thermoplasmata archaeon]
MAKVLIVGGTDESRLLMRGLLRLHHHDVVGEARDAESVGRLGEGEGRLVVVIDADLEDAAWSGAIERLFARRQGTRGVLVTPDRSNRADNRAKALGITTLVRRPFGIEELVDAVLREDTNPVGPGVP